MFEDFKPPNSNQRKFVSNLMIAACIAWSSPIYNIIIRLPLHGFQVSLKYILFLIFSLLAFLFSFVIGFSFLRAAKDD